MVLNAAVQMLREAEELKQKILKFKSGTSMLQDRTLWATQQQLQKVYQKVLVLDLDYALDKKVEQDLWNIGFKQQIEALQAISKDRKNPSRSEGQAMLSWVLQAAAGFYLCLLHQICTTFKLDLPFRRRASLVGVVEGWSVQPATAAAAAARYIAQHCLVHLGDLARYRHHLTLAHTFYRHALLVSAHSGQPYNQLALVAWRRGRKLAAVYWHVRSLLVRAPFPPAPANLARTLAAAREMKDLPVLPGITTTGHKSTNVMPTRPLDARSYVNTLIRTLHMVHTLEDLETATQLVNMLNSSLSALIATDSFESMTLVKMTCVTIWLVHWATESLTVTESSLSASEAQAASLGGSLAAGALLAMLLPAYTLAEPPTHARPALKVYLQWVTQHRQLVSTPAFISRPQLWPALAHTLNKLAEDNQYFNGDLYESVPLPEDEELHGFLPIEASLVGLKFLERAAWDTFGDRIPDFKVDETQADDREDDNSDGESSPSENTQIQLAHEPELEHKIRSHRLILLGRKLAEMCPEMLSVSTEDGRSIFTASSLGGEQLSKALAELSIAAATKADEAEDEEELEAESDEEKPRPAPPVVISEADFREKVREKRVGILKPQGSLERAREERAMANTQDDPEPEEETVEEAAKTEESKKEATRKQRVNIAMAAIMRKQEETNKQVKFVTPPPTPDSMTDTNDASATNKDAKPKVIQPKAIKSLANLPIGRKTGGILSLKDKSAGYPHLQNTDPEPVKKSEKDDVKKESKASQSSQSTHQTYNMPKKQDHAPSPNWPTQGPGMPIQGPYEGPRFNLQHKNYGLQNTGLNYNPNYQAQHNVNNQGIRLPVVNPKEIDVRSAALQKQNLRQEPYQDGHKFGNQNYQISGDKKNFLNDLPPRFANQYRYWQSAQDNQLGSQDNKFREDNFQLGNNTLFGSNPQQPARPNWMMNPPPQMPDTFHQPPPWWKPENPPPNFTPNFSSPPSINLPNFYSPHLTSMPPPNPYQNMPSFNQNFGQNKLDQTMSPNYLSAVGQPQMQTVQNLVSSQNFNSSLNNFGSYQPAVSYDSSMYPQFNKLGYQQAVKGPQYGKDLMEMGGLSFGSNVLADMRRSPLNMNFKEPMHGDVGGNTLDHAEKSESGVPETQGNTYSLFSGAPREAAAWGGAQPQQSLWSGPGPSPLERLLEQQKQMKQPPTEPQ